jgi:hypothetical protein
MYIVLPADPKIPNDLDTVVGKLKSRFALPFAGRLVRRVSREFKLQIGMRNKRRLSKLPVGQLDGNSGWYVIFLQLLVEMMMSEDE